MDARYDILVWGTYAVVVFPASTLPLQSEWLPLFSHVHDRVTASLCSIFDICIYALVYENVSMPNQDRIVGYSTCDKRYLSLRDMLHLSSYHYREEKLFCTWIAGGFFWLVDYEANQWVFFSSLAKDCCLRSDNTKWIDYDNHWVDCQGGRRWLCCFMHAWYFVCFNYWQPNDWKDLDLKQTEGFSCSNSL